MGSFPISLGQPSATQRIGMVKVAIGGRAVDQLGRLRHANPQFPDVLSCCLPPDSSADCGRTQASARANTATHDRQGDQREAGPRPLDRHPPASHRKYRLESGRKTPSKRHRTKRSWDPPPFALRGPHRLRSRAGQSAGNPPETAPWPHPQTAAASSRALATDRKTFRAQWKHVAVRGQTSGKIRANRRHERAGRGACPSD